MILTFFRQRNFPKMISPSKKRMKMMTLTMTKKKKLTMGRHGKFKTGRRDGPRCSPLWWHVLKRRSQTGRLGSERMHRLAQAWLPNPRVLHPYPELRFDARIQGRSRMRE